MNKDTHSASQMHCIVVSFCEFLQVDFLAALNSSGYSQPLGSRYVRFGEMALFARRSQKL